MSQHFFFPVLVNRMRVLLEIQTERLRCTRQPRLVSFQPPNTCSPGEQRYAKYSVIHYEFDYSGKLLCIVYLCCSCKIFNYKLQNVEIYRIILANWTNFNQKCLHLTCFFLQQDCVESITLKKLRIPGDRVRIHDTAQYFVSKDICVYFTMVL